MIGRITIILEAREDGGLRVCSDDLPGLILSHSDPNKVMADILPAINVLQSYPQVPLPSPPMSERRTIDENT